MYGGTGYLLRTSSGTVPVPAARVSDGFFGTLGVKPMLGRDFLPGEDLPGKPKIAMLTYGTWVKRFGARRDVVGQAVSLNGESYTIVGVLPREFAFGPRGNAEFWTPLLDKNGCEQRRSCHNLDGIGRLRDGVTMQAAQADLQAIATQLARQYPGSNQGQGASVIPLSELIVGNVRPILLTLLSGRGSAAADCLRECREPAAGAVREPQARDCGERRAGSDSGAAGAAVCDGGLAAGRRRDALAGLCVGVWVMTLMSRMIPKDMAASVPFLRLVGLNRHTGMFAVAIAGIAALLLAATPVLRLSFQDIRDGLTDGDRGAAGRLWRRMGANLVVVELAIAMVLLVGAGLLGQSFYRLLHVENGFDSIASRDCAGDGAGQDLCEGRSDSGPVWRD